MAATFPLLQTSGGCMPASHWLRCSVFPAEEGCQEGHLGMRCASSWAQLAALSWIGKLQCLLDGFSDCSRRSAGGAGFASEFC